MQRTADLHHQIAAARLPEPAGVVDHTAALDAAIDVLDAHPLAGDASLRCFLPAREGLASRLSSRHEGLDMVARRRKEAQMLEQPMARRSGIWGAIGNPPLVGTTRVGLTQEQDGERGVD
jgi:hypothetical protein